MTIHSHSTYNWTGVDSIDSGENKGSIMDSNNSIDPTFSQAHNSGGADDSAFAGDHVHVAQAVAKVQAASRQVKQQQQQQQQGGAGTEAQHQQAAAVAAQMMAGQATGHGSLGVGAGQPGPLGGSPQGLSGDHGLEINRQGRSLTNTKRAQQNRQAQRAFRQRKELYIKDLEAKVNELKQSKDTIDALRQENIQLRDYILALQSRLIEHPGGVPTPPAVYARQADIYERRKVDK